jgi:predicted Zn-dependent protease
MPSHIYVALGMWQDSIEANEASFRAGDEWRARKDLDVDERYWHACQWLAYSYLQRGRVADAARMLQTIGRDLEASESPSGRMRSYAIAMRAAQGVDAQAWDGPFADLGVDLVGLGKAHVAAEHFARGMAALARGDAASARERIDALRALAPADLVVAAPRGAASCCAPSGERPETVEDQLAALVVARELEGALAAHEGRLADAVARLREAAAREDSMDLDFGPPVVAKPAHELCGELLLRSGDASAAVREFEAALTRAPRRARSLLGLARALRAAGDAAASRAAYRELASIWRAADADLPDLAEVRREAQAGGDAGEPLSDDPR